MTNLENVNLLDLIPPNLQQDEQIQAAAQAIDVELKKTTKQIWFCLLLPRLDELPENLVDELAWQFHVDFYDTTLDIAIKRDLVRQSILWHMKKGTPYAVKSIVGALLVGATVTENWDYGGNPYCFKVDLIEGAIPSEKELDNLYKAIQAVKNTRSWLDGVNFIRNLEQTIYYGGKALQHEEVNIYPSSFNMPDIEGKPYFVAAVGTYSEVEIYG